MKKRSPIGQCTDCGQVIYEPFADHYRKCVEFGKKIKVTPMEPNLLSRARSILQSIVDGSYLDDNRERVADLREWELVNIEKWLEDERCSNESNDTLTSTK